jgi:predicted SprT family Zn-dependent metalloprotease
VKNRRLFRDVLRHELAHIAVVRLGVKGEPHHGSTWRKLLLAVGSKPQVRFLSPVRPIQSTARLFRHECTVCDFTRIAKRRVAAWRCADCVDAGLAGLLTISEVTR